eukprot:TRINITY_DN2160_c0_g3_i1.p1 TRINITY_DN2160_c0_g3~~TRINITY_DN2160_c0_g3_i1.p1  ORF type:complete len:1409 (+),score=521.76 TRINITY_DN2160_c0_g3_i1:41-4267(+)
MYVGTQSSIPLELNNNKYTKPFLMKKRKSVKLQSLEFDSTQNHTQLNETENEYLEPTTKKVKQRQRSRSHKEVTSLLQNNNDSAKNINSHSQSSQNSIHSEAIPKYGTRKKASSSNDIKLDVSNLINENVHNSNNNDLETKSGYNINNSHNEYQQHKRRSEKKSKSGDHSIVDKTSVDGEIKKRSKLDDSMSSKKKTSTATQDMISDSSSNQVSYTINVTSESTDDLSKKKRGSSKKKTSSKSSPVLPITPNTKSAAVPQLLSSSTSSPPSLYSSPSFTKDENDGRSNTSTPNSSPTNLKSASQNSTTSTTSTTSTPSTSTKHRNPSPKEKSFLQFLSPQSTVSQGPPNSNTAANNSPVPLNYSTPAKRVHKTKEVSSSSSTSGSETGIFNIRHSLNFSRKSPDLNKKQVNFPSNTNNNVANGKNLSSKKAYSSSSSPEIEKLVQSPTPQESIEEQPQTTTTSSKRKNTSKRKSLILGKIDSLFDRNNEDETDKRKSPKYPKKSVAYDTEDEPSNEKRKSPKSLKKSQVNNNNNNTNNEIEDNNNNNTDNNNNNDKRKSPKSVKKNGVVYVEVQEEVDEINNDTNKRRSPFITKKRIGYVGEKISVEKEINNNNNNEEDASSSKITKKAKRGSLKSKSTPEEKNGLMYNNAKSSVISKKDQKFQSTLSAPEFDVMTRKYSNDDSMIYVRDEENVDEADEITIVARANSEKHVKISKSAPPPQNNGNNNLPSPLLLSSNGLSIKDRGSYSSPPLSRKTVANTPPVSTPSITNISTPASSIKTRTSTPRSNSSMISKQQVTTSSINNNQQPSTPVNHHQQQQFPSSSSTPNLSRTSLNTGNGLQHAVSVSGTTSTILQTTFQSLTTNDTIIGFVPTLRGVPTTGSPKKFSRRPIKRISQPPAEMSVVSSKLMFEVEPNDKIDIKKRRRSCEIDSGTISRMTSDAEIDLLRLRSRRVSGGRTKTFLNGYSDHFIHNPFEVYKTPPDSYSFLSTPLDVTKKVNSAASLLSTPVNISSSSSLMSSPPPVAKSSLSASGKNYQSGPPCSSPENYIICHKNSNRFRVACAGTRGQRDYMEDHVVVYGQFGHPDSVEENNQKVKDLVANSPDLKIVPPLMNTVPTRRSMDLFGVFDGHNGNLAVSYVSTHLPSQLLEVYARALQNRDRDPNSVLNEGIEPEIILKTAFLETNNKFKLTGLKGGTTAIIVLAVDDTIYVANAGDCRCVILNPKGKYKRITRDHRPTELLEVKRIQERGGTITNKVGKDGKRISRVNGVLGVSRSFGDFNLGPVIAPEPDVFILNRSASGGSDTIFRSSSSSSSSSLSSPSSPTMTYVIGPTDLLVVASDGLWDVLNDDEVASIIQYYLKTDKTNPLETACIRLRDAAFHRSSKDNISIMIIQPLNPGVDDVGTKKKD